MRLRASLAFACLAAAFGHATSSAGQQGDSVSSGRFGFTPLATSAPCVPGGAGTFPNEQPFLLPLEYEQTVIARQGDGGTIDNWDMHVLNENGPHAGEFLYHSHETTENGMVSVTDLRTGQTRVLAQQEYWNRLDGLVWTPWGTLLTGEEMRLCGCPLRPIPACPKRRRA